MACDQYELIPDLHLPLPSLCTSVEEYSRLVNSKYLRDETVRLEKMDPFRVHLEM
jgi:hypothetical protein